MAQSLTETFLQAFGRIGKNANEYSGLDLAYIGDAVYDLVIRTLVLSEGNAPVNKLHHRVSGIVKAEAQKDSLHRIEELLTEEEQAVYRRGRNANAHTTAKNASVGDYRIATGFEALIGYLYLKGETDRMLELIRAGLPED